MVNWNADKDQTILKGIFAFHDIKNSAPLLKYLSEQIGEGCTPKAVGHRLSNLRNSGKMVNTNGSGVTPKKTAPTPRTPRTPQTPASGRGKAKVAKNVINSKTASEETTDDDEEPVASPSVGRKRVRTPKTPVTYAESDAATDDEEEFKFVTKRVKTEPVEDDGVAGTANGTGHLGFDDEDVAFV